MINNVFPRSSYIVINGVFIENKIIAHCISIRVALKFYV